MSRSEPNLIVPSPVRRLLVEQTNELWLKDDSLICAVYGGNKPRKLVHLLDDAVKRGAKRLVTVGALGSHHVLATGLMGRHIGLPTTAIVLPRPFSNHAEQTTTNTLAAGVELIALGNPGDLRRLVGRVGRRGDYWIPPGGSNAIGALGYLEAARELKRQIDEQLVPLPDVIVVALGSGGTAAGLLAGLASEKLSTELVAVAVLRLPLATAVVQSLGRAALRRSGCATSPGFAGQLTIDNAWIGKGYGHPTAAGELAIAEAASFGLTLEPTYTGKAFACALARLRATRRSQRILFWSTFSAVSLANTANCAATLPLALGRLFRPS
jgi:D-cysteine desulfhydrase